MHWYFLTIKNNRARYTSIRELNEYYAKFRELIPRADYTDQIGYELDSKNRMHLHTVFCVPNQLSCKDTNAMANYGSVQHHIKRFPFKDLERVVKYATQEKVPYIKEEISYQYWLHRSLPRIV